MRPKPAAVAVATQYQQIGVRAGRNDFSFHSATARLDSRGPAQPAGRRVEQGLLTGDGGLVDSSRDRPVAAQQAGERATQQLINLVRYDVQQHHLGIGADNRPGTVDGSLPNTFGDPHHDEHAILLHRPTRPLSAHSAEPAPPARTQHTVSAPANPAARWLGRTRPLRSPSGGELTTTPTSHPAQKQGPYRALRRALRFIVLLISSSF